MKKTAFLIVIAVLCAAVLTSCSEKTAEGQSGFRSPSALAGLLSAYFKSLDSNLLYPSENAAASSDIEFSYSTEDGVQTEHKALTAAYFKEKKALSVGIGDHIIDVAGTVSFDGAALRDITSEFMFRTVSSAFVTAFCDKSSSGDFTTAPDSISSTKNGTARRSILRSRLLRAMKPRTVFLPISLIFTAFCTAGSRAERSFWLK